MMILALAAAAAAAAAQPAEPPPRFDRSIRPVVQIALPPSAHAETPPDAIPLVYADLAPMLDQAPAVPRASPKLRYQPPRPIEDIEVATPPM